MLLGEKFDPMLFIRARSLESLFIEWESVIASPKIDGIRMVAHKIGNNVMLFSRTGRNITDKFPSIAESIRKQFVRDIVLDGEMVAIHEGNMLPFSQAMAKFQGNETHGKGKACLMVFDCLWMGEDISSLPFVDRLGHVLRAINTASNLQVIPHSEMKDEQGIENLYRKILSKGFEGLVLRDAYAGYEFGRSNSVRKIKPLHTHDLKIIGKEQNKTHSFIYTLEPMEGNNPVKVRDFRQFRIGDVVEIVYENVTENGCLKFPRILRLREKN